MFKKIECSAVFLQCIEIKDLNPVSDGISEVENVKMSI